MDSTITTTLADMLTDPPDAAVFVDLHLHREPVTITYQQDG